MRRSHHFDALTIAVLLGVAACSGGDGSSGDAATTTSARAATSTAPSSTTVVPRREPTAVWPVSAAEAFPTPVEAARSFAVDYLHFRDPLVGSFRSGDARSGEVDVRPGSPGPVTTVLVRQLSGETGWSVIGASTPNIVLEQPAALAAVRSPVAVRGTGLAFEGNILVEVRDDVSVEPLGSGFVTAGGDVLRPFEGSVPFLAPRSDGGAVVLYTASAEDGRVWEASVLRIAFSDACDAPSGAGDPDEDEMLVTAFFTCDAGGSAPSLRPVQRVVPRSPGVLAASLRALVAGPTSAERRGSLTSWFSQATAGALRSVTITEGHTVVDLRDLRGLIPNASTSAGSARLLAELDATVFQFLTVTTAEYRLDGSCEDFTEWLQVGGCDPRQRPAP